VLFPDHDDNANAKNMGKENEGTKYNRNTGVKNVRMENTRPKL